MKSLKNLLHMKFMQRALDSETKKQLEEEEKKIISEEHLYLDLPELKEKECFIKEKQIFLLREDLLCGRKSEDLILRHTQRERERERGRDTGRGRSRLPTRSPK
uniref:Uncharacterized protein n=2 Tax=Canis lupus familiaris TaxID=9615 RepID=A0A8I3PA60_CANLF